MGDYDVLIYHLRECHRLFGNENTFSQAADAIEELDRCYDRLAKDYREAAEMIRSFREKIPYWTKCSDKLPPEPGRYLVFVNATQDPVRLYRYKPESEEMKVLYENENLWVKEDGSYVLNHFVTHWMALPSVPIVSLEFRAVRKETE